MFLGIILETHSSINICFTSWWAANVHQLTWTNCLWVNEAESFDITGEAISMKFASLKEVRNELMEPFRCTWPTFTCLFQLYKAAVANRPKTYGPAEFVPFNASLGYGHKLIFMAPELPEIIRYLLTTTLIIEKNIEQKVVFLCCGEVLWSGIVCCPTCIKGKRSLTKVGQTVMAGCMSWSWGQTIVFKNAI